MADSQNAQNSAMHWLLAGALLIIAVFAFVIITIVRSQADSVTTTTSINNATPAVDSVYVSSSANGGADSYGAGLDLTSGTTKTIHINGVVSDANGADDISTVALDLYRSAQGATCSDDNNDCYSVATCTLGADTATTKTYNCSVAVQFYADATATGAPEYAANNWLAKVTVTDDVAATANSTHGGFEVNELLSLTIPSSLSLGTFALGATTTASNNTAYLLTQQGNQAADVEVSMGSAMSCTQQGSIPVANLEWALTDVDQGDVATTDLTGSAVDTAVNVTTRTDDATASTKNLYWNITVPSTGVAGTCTGTLTVTAIDQTP